MTAVGLQSVVDFLEAFAPLELAEDWDNVGLLVGDREQSVRRVMTCLTITPASLAEACRESADLVITHHPLPFRSLKRLTTDSTPGKMLLQAIRSGVAIYSPHTAFDSARAGINHQLAAGIGLQEVQPLQPADSLADIGAGRFGKLGVESSLEALAERVCEFLQIDSLELVGSAQQVVRQVAVACGSAGSFLEPAQRAGCDVLLTGETTFHTCLEAEAQGIGLLLPGHFHSERFALLTLAQTLSEQFPNLMIWASVEETDPIRRFAR